MTDYERVRAILDAPHHLGFPLSSRTGTYDSHIVMVKREWYTVARNLAPELLAVAEDSAAMLTAWQGASHPGEPHDRELHVAGRHDDDCSGSYADDCGRCGGAMYGTEVELRAALDALHAKMKETP